MQVPAINGNVAPRPGLGGLRYEMRVLPVGAQGTGELHCKPGTRLHSVVPLPRGAISGSPLMVLVVLEIGHGGH